MPVAFAFAMVVVVGGVPTVIFHRGGIRAAAGFGTDSAASSFIRISGSAPAGRW